MLQDYATCPSQEYVFICLFLAFERHDCATLFQKTYLKIQTLAGSKDTQEGILKHSYDTKTNYRIGVRL